MWERGDAAWFVADFLGYSDSGLRGLVDRHGWTRPSGYAEAVRAACRWNPTEAQILQLASMWDAGQTAFEMSLEFNVSYRAIANAARRLGLRRRSRRTLNEIRRSLPGILGDAQARVEAVAKLLSHGVDRDIIAEHIGVSRASVSNFAGEARRQGLLSSYERRPWKPGPREIAIVKHGFRLGIFFSTIGFLIDEERPITADAVKMLGRRLDIVPRNRFLLFRLLAPEQLYAAECAGIDPVDRVQHLWRNTLALTEEHGLRALDDHLEAFDRFPSLRGVMAPLRKMRSFGAPRPPNARIAACRGLFFVTDHHGDASCVTSRDLPISDACSPKRRLDADPTSGRVQPSGNG